MGTGRRLKEYRRDIEVWAVEPADSLHGLEGLKHMASSLVPPIYHPEELDGVLPMDTDEAWDISERLAKHEGHAGRAFVGRVAGGRRAHRQAAGRGGQAGRDRDAVPRPRRALLRGARAARSVQMRAVVARPTPP